MKSLILKITVLCFCGMVAPAIAQNTDNGAGPESMPAMAPEDASPDVAPPPEQGGMEAADNAPEQNAAPANVPALNPEAAAADKTSPASASDQAPRETVAAYAPPGETAATNADRLILNFRNVPLDMVLNYLSDAAGFIIVMDTQVRGTVSVISAHPMTRNEAVDLLNSVLNRNGYAAIRNGRTLTIVDKSEAKTRDIPVKVSNDPNSIPKNDEIVTQIIPVRYVDASQLMSDLSSFVSSQATMVANQAGNSIVITDTQENIRHLVEIIRAIDSSAAGETEIRVFNLKFANPNDVATELGSIFPSGNTTGQGQMPIRFGGGGGPGGFFARMMAANAGNNQNNNRAQKQSQVTAVADARTQSVIVMASKDLMTEIGEMMQQLDVPSARDQKV
ncbi:MAG TPA: secretin N-terminal domain-containing protein, partial [Verrucomicrobiae bacterium]|nr:secretin N-terminal domain-containing protein [Verrucomicrobiae bacterium]